jgi:ABC-2 type transport system permease protein
MNAPVRPLRFSTVVDVELRKMTDTRASRGLLAGIGGLLVVVLGWKVAHPGIPATFHNYAAGAAAVVAYAAPILALLAMSSEWTQRTTLTTFTLAPRRAEVMSAKLVSALVVSAALGVLAVVLAAAGVALAGALHGGASFAGLLGDVRGVMTVVILHTLLGAGFGALAQQSTVALAIYFVAPIVWSNIAGQVLHGLARWLDVFVAYDRLASAAPLAGLGQTLTAVSVWVLVPAALGFARSLRREVA